MYNERVSSIGKKRKKKKTVIDGIEFDSKLEANHYELMKADKDIEILDVHKTFKLMPKFQYIGFPKFNKRTHRHMIYTPDFVIKFKGVDKPIAVESKGHPRKDYMIRKKLFTLYYSDDYYFYECRSVKQMEEDFKMVKDKVSK